MRLIPAGDFLRGDDRPAPSEDEVNTASPRRTIYLDAFYIDTFEVTNADYRRFVLATGRKPPRWRAAGPRWGGDWRRFSWSDNRPQPGASDLPVTLVSWFDAEAYCAWLGRRLPTEAEWEKAARGTRARAYPWGDAPDSGRANFGKSRKGPLPGGSLPGGASPYGVMDMAGNVAEWVADYYSPTYYKRSPERSPKGPRAGSRRSIRGGHWLHPAHLVRADSRWWGIPTRRHGGVGFRCARSAGAEK